MKIVVIGGSGRIGSKLVASLQLARHLFDGRVSLLERRQHARSDLVLHETQCLDELRLHRALERKLGITVFGPQGY